MVVDSNTEDDGEKELSLQACRDRTKKELRKTFQSGGHHLIEALPAMGKSYSTFKVAAEMDTSIIYLTSLNKLKKQAEDWCGEHGLDYHRVPTPHTTCPCFDDNHYPSLAAELRADYRKGLTGKDLHNLKSLPCNENGPCTYIEELEKDVSNVAVLIGNPKHAYNEDYLINRIVIKDEFSEQEYETKFTNPRNIVNKFLKNVSIPFESYDDLISERDGDSFEKIGRTQLWFQKYGAYRDAQTAINTHKYHVYAPLLTYALVYGTTWELANGWEHVPIDVFSSIDDLDYVPVGPNAVVVRNSATDSMYLLDPPRFEIADGFVGLDGTPTPKLWETATGLNLTHHQLLDANEKEEYISDTIKYDIIQTNNSEKAYSGGGGVTAAKDTKIAYFIHLKEGERLGLISSKRAIKNEYPDENNGEIFQYIDGENILNFAMVQSSNELADKHLGLITGSRHYGDDYIQKWGAYEGESVPSPDERGPNKSYGDLGDEVHQHLKNQTLQDVFRFGRDTKPTTVYVNTCVLPDWVPVRKLNKLHEYKPSTRETVEYLRDSTSPSSAREISEEIDRHKSTVTRNLSNLVDEGLVNKEEQFGHNDPHLYTWVGYSN